MSNCNVIFGDLRASKKDGVRYARVRAIANGTDSYNSIFTKNAREKLIDGLKHNGVKANALHAKHIDDNIELFLKDKIKSANSKDREIIQNLLGHMDNKEFPIGNVVDAYFVDDNIVEAVIKENTNLKLLGDEYTSYLDGAWNMIEDGTLGGVSVVFNELKTFNSDGTLYIDDLKVRGLDFVDRASHKDTRVIETFMRAMQKEVKIEENQMTEEQPKTGTSLPKESTTPSGFKSVDDIVEKTEQRIEANMQEKEARAQEIADIKAGYETKLEEQKEAFEAEKTRADEALEIASKAIEQRDEVAAKTDNPFVQRIQENLDADNAPGKNLSIAELIAMKERL